MTQAEVNAILDSHEKWLRNKKEGERANFSNQDLRGIILPYRRLDNVIFDGANLENAAFYRSNLESCNFNRCKMRFAEFLGATIGHCEFSESDLQCAVFKHSAIRGGVWNRANLLRANFDNAIIANASFCDALLTQASFCDAILRDCSFCRADFERTFLNRATIRSCNLFEALNLPALADTSIVPECGSFIGWKRVGAHIIKLEIPEDAKRCNANGRKCRCSHARVLEIQTLSGQESSLKSITNHTYTPAVTYTVGETVYPDSFNENRWAECTNGIHFFITRQEAVDYLV